MKIILVSLFTLIIQYSLLSQCTTYNAPTGDCASGTTGTLTNGSNVNPNDILSFNDASAANFNNINLNGGTIRVCGTLIISSLSINGGTIIVAPSGNLTIENNELNVNGNVQIVNRGTLHFSGNVTMQNTNNYIYNDGTYTQDGTLNLSSDTSHFMNAPNRTATIYEFRNNEGITCLGSNSILNVDHYTNNHNSTCEFSSVSGSPSACIYIHTLSELNAAVFTNDTEISVCYLPNSQQAQSGTWGAAQVTYGCNSCVTLLSSPPTILSIQLHKFEVNMEGEEVRVIWETLNETNNEYFSIERSSNGKNWDNIENIRGSEYSKELIKYEHIDEEPLLGKSYYRLLQTDFDGKIVYSDTRSITNTGNINLYPNPIYNYLTVEGVEAKDLNYKVFNSVGKDVTISTSLIELNNPNAVIDMSHLSRGLYYISTLENTYKIIKH